MIASLAGQKGGIGKSTLAVNTIVALVLSGKKGVLVDADPKQGSSSLWNDVRREAIEEGVDLPDITCVKLSGKHIKKDLIELEEKFGNVVVDTPGRDSPAMRAALLASDIAITPVVPSIFDIGAALHMTEVFEEVKSINEELKIFAVISKSSSHPRDNDANETKNILRNVDEKGKPLKEEDENGNLVETENPFKDFILTKTAIKDRSVWRRATGAGKSVLEMPKSKASLAIKEFKLFLKETNILGAAT